MELLFEEKLKSEELSFEFENKFFENIVKPPKTMKYHKGTTTLSFIFQEGIIVAVDSRATAGQYIASQTVQKAIPINTYMMGTMAGGAADCQFFLGHLSRICNLFELRNGTRISIASASQILANLMNSYRGLSLGSMICGYDELGPQLYYVDNDGTRLKGKIFSVGSGSPFAYGILDTEYRFEMTVEEASELGRRAICAATSHDSASGGTIKVYYIGPNGWRKVSDEDASEVQWEYLNKI